MPLAACTPIEPDPKRPLREGLRFYRAEPRPAHWADERWPDTWNGGRWGPPYALLQGSLRAVGDAGGVQVKYLTTARVGLVLTQDTTCFYLILLLRAFRRLSCELRRLLRKQIARATHSSREGW